MEEVWYISYVTNDGLLKIYSRNGLGNISPTLKTVRITFGYLIQTKTFRPYK